jgi:hypothetical protein
MKKSLLILVIAGFLAIGLSEVQAQTTQTKLNQVELLKQFLGSWKWDAGKDTTGYYDAKSYGTGLEGNLRFVTNGKTYTEGKQLMGYDKSSDKLIQSQMLKGRNIGCYAYYFITNKKYEIIPYSDISNPEKAPWKCEGEFTSPDTYVETTIVKNKPPEIVTFTRVK